MILCEHCFKDKELSLIICSLKIEKKGICPICGSERKFCYDTTIQNELTPYFEELLNIYVIDSQLTNSYPKSDRHMLSDDLYHRWNIFSSEVSRNNYFEILTSICADRYKNIPQLFSSPVGIPELYNQEFLKEHSLLKNNNWNSFVNEIKTKNRYHSKLLNFDILRKYCTFIRKKLNAGEIFYRARISDNKGFEAKEMGVPPSNRSVEGRANARGITCLYLANDLDTTFHEVRAGAYDFISVGKFKLKEDIFIVDLSLISDISPFTGNLDFIEFAINKPFLEKLNTEISKPLRKNDSTLDYIPTQYIVDFIKSIEHNNKYEYSGIKYNSTTNPGGYNLAIFNPNVFECISVEVYDINSLHYVYKRLKN